MEEGRQLLVLFVTDVITNFVIPLLLVIISIAAYRLQEWLLMKFSSERLAVIKNVAGIAVRSAEQLGATNRIADKYAYALERTQAALLQRGINVDVKELSAIIEAEVREQFTMFPEIELVAEPVFLGDELEDTAGA